MVKSRQGMGGEGRGIGLGLLAADRIARSLLGAAHAAGPGVGERLAEFELLECLEVSSAQTLYRASSSGEPGPVLVMLGESGEDRLQLETEAKRAAIAASGDPRLIPILATGRTREHRAWCAFPAPTGRGIGRWCEESAASLEIRLQLLGGFAAAVAALHAGGAPHGALCEESVFVDERGTKPRVRIAPCRVSASPAAEEERQRAFDRVAEEDLRAIAAISIAALAARPRSSGAEAGGASKPDAGSLPWRVGRELRRLLSLGERRQGRVALLAAAFARRVGDEIAAE